MSDMKQPDERLMTRCLERVRELPFVDKAVLRPPTSGQHENWDGVLRIVTPKATREFAIEAKRTHLTQAIVDGAIANAARYKPKDWVLFAPHVGRPLAKYLAEQDVNFVDLAGNCRLRIGREHHAMIEGRAAERRPRQGRGIGAPGLQVLFALLARPELAGGPIRELAGAAGVAAATAAHRMAQLLDEGLIQQVNRAKRLTDTRKLLDLWLNGYTTQVRPRLLVGRYRTQDADPEALERRIEEALGTDVTWGWGGGAAAQRLTKYYRGLDTVLHIQRPVQDLARRLRALRAEDGPLIVLKAPGPIAFEGVRPQTVNPLLVYTELLFVGDKRAREAAAEVRKQFLVHLP